MNTVPKNPIFRFPKHRDTEKALNKFFERHQYDSYNKRQKQLNRKTKSQPYKTTMITANYKNKKTLKRKAIGESSFGPWRLAQKYKYSRSNTRKTQNRGRRTKRRKTSRKFSKKTLGIAGSGDSNSSVAYFHKKNIPKTVKIVSNPFISKGCDGLTCTSNIAVQGISNFATALNSNQISNAVQYANVFYAENAAVGPMENNHGTVAGYQSRKVFIQSYQEEFFFVNQGVTEVNFIMYDLVCKNSGAIVDPGERWSTGLADQAMFGGGGLQTIPGAKPTESKLFNMAFWIKKKTVVNIAPGRTHKHVISNTVNKLLDTQYLNEYAQIRGLTTYLMTVQFGKVIDSSTALAANNITIAPTKLICQRNWSLTVRGINDFPRGYRSVNNMGVLGIIRYTMNEGTDAVSQVVDAANNPVGFA